MKCPKCGTDNPSVPKFTWRLMRNLALSFLLIICFSIVFAKNDGIEKIQKGGSNASKKYEKLKKTALEKYSEIMTLLRPEAKKKLSTAYRAFLNRLVKSADSYDLDGLARTEVQNQFGSLSKIQKDIGVFCILVNLMKDLDNPDMIQQNMQMNMEFLALQNYMQIESRSYNAVSNALKARHDKTVEAMRNMK